MRLTRQFVAPSIVCLSILAAGCGGGGSEPTAGPPASISPLSGSSATVVAGTTAPITLVAKVLDAAGRAVPGAGVTWGTTSGGISPATATTDGSGQTTALWTPGTVAGSQTATATVAGIASATFSLTITAGTLAQLKLTPDTLRFTAAFQTAVLTLTASDAFNNPIPANLVSTTYTTENPSVATVSGAGTVTARGDGATVIHAVAGAASASTVVLVNIAAGTDPCAGGSMTLAVGESQTLTGTAADHFCVSGGAGGAEFVAIPFFGTGNGGTGSGSGSFVAAPSLPITVTPINNIGAAGPPSPSVLAPVARANVVSAGGQTLSRDFSWESRFRERTRRELTTLLRATRQARRQSNSGVRNSLSLSADVNVGTPLNFNVSLAGCDSNSVTTVPATVRAVSNHAIVVSDDRNPAGFIQSDYDAIASAFDQQVWKTDTDNFGVPYAWNWTTTPARDPNAKIILFFTRAVNELTPQSSSSFVGGFFYARDLYPKTFNGKTVCKPSNETEMFYLLAPDPDGTINNNKRSTDFVRSITTGTVAHEFQHLINAAYRFFVPNINFINLEETFLDEGLAHIAEELNYYTATNRVPRSNLDAAGAINPPDPWVAFGDQNAVRFREYLKNPDKYPPYSVLADTSLSVRGAIWSFLRYATDRRVAAGTPEQTTWFQLVNPPSELNGVAHLQAVYGADVLSQVRDWTVANYLDDALSATTPAAFKNPSWNTRSIETFVNGSSGSGLPHANGTVFPLKTTSLVSNPRTISLADGGAAYIRFGVDAGKVGGGTLTSSSGLPTSFSVTVVRTK